VASLLDPVGPLGRGVYWRRRLVLIGVVVVVLLLLAKACSGGGGDAAATSHPSTGNSPHSTPTSSTHASSTAHASSTPSAAAKPVGDCKDSDIAVTATPAKKNYPAGSSVSITYVVATKNGVRCKRDVGQAADEVRVTSGQNIVWSSDFCNPGGKKDVRTIGPNDSFSVVVDWNGNVTTSACPTDQLPAPAGNYLVVGRNGNVVGPGAKLTLG